MHETIQKLLTIKNPEQYYCTVWNYQVGHSEMFVRVYKTDVKDAENDAFYLIFQVVSYFEGPLNWPSLNLRVGNVEECRKILTQIGLHFTKEIIETDYYQLFTFTLPHTEVKIIARNLLKANNFNKGESADSS
jgi:hypothetical protein